MLPTFAYSQTSFSCKYREYCDWNSVTEEFESDCEGYAESSLFVMNESETMFTHTIESTQTTYYVESKESGENGLFTYNVVSESGNHYYFLFDMANNEVKSIALDEDGEAPLLRFYVKAVF